MMPFEIFPPPGSLLKRYVEIREYVCLSTRFLIQRFKSCPIFRRMTV